MCYHAQCDSRVPNGISVLHIVWSKVFGPLASHPSVEDVVDLLKTFPSR